MNQHRCVVSRLSKSRHHLSCFQWMFSLFFLGCMVFKKLSNVFDDLVLLGEGAGGRALRVCHLGRVRPQSGLIFLIC